MDARCVFPVSRHLVTLICLTADTPEQFSVMGVVTFAFRLRSLAAQLYGFASRISTVMLLCMAVSVESQPLIAVRDVRASSRWYGRLFAADSLPDHPHRDFYDRVFSAGRLILQLHAWDAENHPNLINANAAPPGHGVVLWFQVNDFDSVVDRARELSAEVVLEPHVNPAPQHREIWLRDPDGYVLVIASADGEVSR